MAEVLLRKVASEIEANALVAYLASQSCQATVKNRTIIAYPGIAEPPGPVAEVWVDDAELERAQALAAVYDEADLDESDLEAQAIAAKPRERRAARLKLPFTTRGIVLGVLTLSSLGFNAYAAYVLYLEPLPTEVEGFDTSGERISLSHFHPDAPYPYEVEWYGADGKVVSRQFDEDGNGLTEEMRLELPRSDRALTHVSYFDLDGDAIYERAGVYANTQVHVEIEDTDADGIFDTWKHPQSGFQLDDDDSDGMPDHFTCSAPGSGARTIALFTEVCVGR